jgi:hypothetical protein
MSTISSKYVPLNQRAYKPLNEERLAAFPRKASSESKTTFKSSVCFAEERPENHPQVLMHSTKKLDFDVLGDELLKNAAANREKQLQEKQIIQTMINDLRSKHYELGSDSDACLKDSLYQSDYIEWGSNCLNESRENTMVIGSGKCIDTGKTGYFVSERDIDNWNQETTKSTSYTQNFCSPYQQILNNSIQGRDLLLDSHLKPRSQQKQELAKSSTEETQKEILANLMGNEKQGILKIKADLTKCHFVLGDHKESFETVHNQTYTPKQREENRVDFGAEDIRKSSIVLGYQTKEERLQDYMTIYTSELCGLAKNIDPSEQTVLHKASRDGIKEKLYTTSVIYGSDRVEDAYVTHYKGEFRNVKYV